MLTDRYLTGEAYRAILRNTLVPFARQHFGDNYCYQYDITTPHRDRVVLDFFQQGNVTKMEQPARSPDCSHIFSMNWAVQSPVCTTRPRILVSYAKPCSINREDPVERLQHPAASKPQRPAAIIAARGENTWYWPGIHKTTPTGCIMQIIKFVWPNLPQLPSNYI